MELITNWERFAEITIQTNDLDPMYSLIGGIAEDRGEDDASRFIMAFTTFYNAGFAAQAMWETTQENFWEYMLDQYWTAPRGTERRHYRGTMGENWLRNVAEIGPPQAVLAKWYAPTYSGVLKNITPNCGYGPYFAWKLLDIYERCLGWPVSISMLEALKHMPSEPRACAEAYFPGMSFQDALSLVTGAISRYKAPPRLDRACGYQEAETILCMIKGFFITKTHVIGDDIAEKRASLKDCPELLSYLPLPVPGGMYGRP